MRVSVLDSLDVRIFRALVHDRSGTGFVSDARWSYGKVAKALGVDRGVVRTRVKKLEDEGFLRGWAIITNPRLLGKRVFQAWLDFHPPSKKGDLVRKLQLVDGIVVLENLVGGSIYFVGLYESDEVLKRRLELIQRMSDPDSLSTSEITFPICEVQPSKVDIELMKELQHDPRRSYTDLEKKLGVSTKTIKRRLARLIEGRAVFVLPRMDPGALYGSTIADLLVKYSDPKLKVDVDGEIMAKFDDQLVRAEVGSKDVGYFNFVLNNIGQTQEILEWVEGKRGVAGARVDMVLSRSEFYGRFNEDLDGYEGKLVLGRRLLRSD